MEMVPSAREIVTVLPIQIHDERAERLAFEKRMKVLRRARIRAGHYTCDGFGEKCDRTVSANKQWCRQHYRLVLVKHYPEQLEAFDASQSAILDQR